MKQVNILIPLRSRLFVLFLLLALNSNSQDFYNHDNSVKFGKYLYNSTQFELAVLEFERCVYLKPDDRESYLYLFKINRKLNLFDKAINAFQRFNGNLNFEEMDASFGTEYFKLLVQNGKYQEASFFLDKNPCFKENSNFRLSTILMRKEWGNAFAYQSSLNNSIDKTLSSITERGALLKNKSPVLAGLLSTIIPGSGKVYAGKWKDGLISFVMTTTASFVAIRGFVKDRNSVYPWIMGSMAIAYYSGNIYGSAVAAKKYNTDKEDELAKQALDFVLTDK
jgi:tetratricopeptide (TPR) repeat protein